MELGALGDSPAPPYGYYPRRNNKQDTGQRCKMYVIYEAMGMHIGMVLKKHIKKKRINPLGFIRILFS